MKTLETPIHARMNHPVQVLPEAMDALQALGKVAHSGAVPAATLALVELRASQLNGCSVCVDLHARDLKKLGEPDERIIGVTAWRENPAFNEAERAALALTDSLTRLSGVGEAVPEEVWDEAAKHYDEKALATLLIAIAGINVWNRLNAAIRQPVGRWRG